MPPKQISDNSERVIADGSGTAAAAAVGMDFCQFKPSEFKSETPTKPSASKSPLDQGSGLVYQFVPTTFKSPTSTDPSRLASPGRYGSATPFSVAATARHSSLGVYLSVNCNIVE